jgi:hypothetical protein
MRFSRFSRFAVILLAAAAAACESGTAPDAMPPLAGSYAAVAGHGAFTVTSAGSGSTTDLIAEGGRIELDLHPNGTTSGRLHLPGAGDDGGDFDADLIGTWARSGDLVLLSHAADTFLRDMPLAIRGDRLEGDQAFGGSRVRVVLVRR